MRKDTFICYCERCRSPHPLRFTIFVHQRDSRPTFFTVACSMDADKRISPADDDTRTTVFMPFPSFEEAYNFITASRGFDPTAHIEVVAGRISPGNTPAVLKSPSVGAVCDYQFFDAVAELPSSRSNFADAA